MSIKDPQYLYRGVSKIKGALTPKSPGKPFASQAQCGDPHAVCGSGVVCAGRDAALVNEVIFHEWRQQGLPTSGISTTPFRNRAEVYARGRDGLQFGHVLKIELELLGEHGVRCYRVKAIAEIPSMPEDDEYVLVAEDYHDIPSAVVVDTCKVPSKKD